MVLSIKLKRKVEYVTQQEGRLYEDKELWEGFIEMIHNSTEQSFLTSQQPSSWSRNSPLYETGNFNTIFTTACHLSLTKTSLRWSTESKEIWRRIFSLSRPVRYGSHKSLQTVTVISILQLNNNIQEVFSTSQSWTINPSVRMGQRV